MTPPNASLLFKNKSHWSQRNVKRVEARCVWLRNGVEKLVFWNCGIDLENKHNYRNNFFAKKMSIIPTKKSLLTMLHFLTLKSKYLGFSTRPISSDNRRSCVCHFHLDCLGGSASIHKRHLRHMVTNSAFAHSLHQAQLLPFSEFQHERWLGKGWWVWGFPWDGWRYEGKMFFVCIVS